MPEEEEVEANMKEIAEKASENKTIKSMPDVCETPQSPSMHAKNCGLLFN